jgi:acyl dehydratase
MTERIQIPADQWLNKAGKLDATSNWLVVTQAMIHQFAEATDDHQFIHVDPVRARAETEFGGTIAHGFLTLSLLSKLVVDAMPVIANRKMAINYGFDRIRFITPVLAGSRIRGHFQLKECSERKAGEILSKYLVSVEIEGVDKPALVAEWLGLTLI